MGNLNLKLIDIAGLIFFLMFCQANISSRIIRNISFINYNQLQKIKAIVEEKKRLEEIIDNLSEEFSLRIIERKDLPPPQGGPSYIRYIDSQIQNSLLLVVKGVEIKNDGLLRFATRAWDAAWADLGEDFRNTEVTVLFAKNIVGKASVIGVIKEEEEVLSYRFLPFLYLRSGELFRTYPYGDKLMEVFYSAERKEEEVIAEGLYLDNEARFMKGGKRIYKFNLEYKNAQIKVIFIDKMRKEDIFLNGKLIKANVLEITIELIRDQEGNLIPPNAEQKLVRLKILCDSLGSSFYKIEILKS